MPTYAETIASLLETSPFDLDTGLQVAGSRPTMANSEFLTNRQQGDWAETIVLNAINGHSNEYRAVPYGRSESLAAGDPGFVEFYAAYQDELNSIGKKPDILIFRKSDLADDASCDLEDAELVRRSVAAIEVRSSSFLANKYSAFMRDRLQTADQECRRLQNLLLQEPMSSLLQEKSPEIHGLT